MTHQDTYQHSMFDQLPTEGTAAHAEQAAHLAALWGDSAHAQLATDAMIIAERTHRVAAILAELADVPGGAA